jgi:Protein of unknown function (DUF1203)
LALTARCGTLLGGKSGNIGPTNPKGPHPMTYRIEPLSRDAFEPLFAMTDDELAEHNAVRVTANGPGFPCRVSLADAQAGETLILINHTSHDVATPYRSTYAIYVRENAVEAKPLIDSTPPVFEGRPIALRGFDEGGMLRNAALAAPGTADSRIRDLFASPEIAYIHAHNAAHGCYSCRIVRS